MNVKGKGHYTHEVVQEFDSMDEIESFISELRIEAQKAFSNKSDSGLIIGTGQTEYRRDADNMNAAHNISFQCQDDWLKVHGVEIVFEIDSVGKIFGKGGRFIGALTEEELKSFYKSVPPLHLKVPTNLVE